MERVGGTKGAIFEMALAFNNVLVAFVNGERRSCHHSAMGEEVSKSGSCGGDRRSCNQVNDIGRYALFEYVEANLEAYPERRAFSPNVSTIRKTEKMLEIAILQKKCFSCLDKP